MVPIPITNLDEREVREYLDKSAEQADPPRKRVLEPLAKKVYDVSQGHPATVAAVDELLWGSKALPGTDPRELLRDLPERPGERAAALVERLVRDDDALERALWAAAVPRQFDALLLEDLLADDPLSSDDQKRVFDALGGFKFTEKLPPDEKLRLHSYVRNGLLQRMQRTDPKRLDALHALAADHYMRDLVAEGQDGSAYCYGDAFIYEKPEWQRNKREWLYHRGHASSEDAQLNALLEFTRLFLDAFWWWGNYIHFDFCDQLVTDLAHLAGRRVPKLEALHQALRRILREYPLRSVKSEDANWDEVRKALLNVQRLCGLQARDARWLAGDQRKDQRHVAALLLVFLAHTWRYQAPDRPEADQYYSRAADLFAQDKDWSEAWVAFERADLRQERGKVDAVRKLWEHAAGLVQPHEVEAASIEVAREVQAAAEKQVKEEVDQEVVSNLHRLRGDCCWASDDKVRSATWYGRAVLHAYLFHLVGGPPDDYTLQFYVDIRARALSRLFHVWRGDQDTAVALATEMAQTFPAMPGQGPGRAPDQLRRLLADGKPVPLAHALFPKGPEVPELGIEDSPFIDEFNALVEALNTQRASGDLHDPAWP